VLYSLWLMIMRLPSGLGYWADLLSNRARRAGLVSETDALERELIFEGACVGKDAP
jgi:hypothetical protein